MDSGIHGFGLVAGGLLGMWKKVTSFVECSRQLIEGLGKAGHPSPWQYCRFEDDSESCRDSCVPTFGYSGHPMRRRWGTECWGHY